MRLGADWADEVVRITGKAREEIDWWLDDGEIIVLSPAQGVVFVAVPLLDRAYLVHQFAADGCRGRVTRDGGEKAIAWMFEHTDAVKLIGLTPATNRAACMMAAMIGLEREGLIKGATVEGGNRIDMVLFGLGKREG